MREINVPQNNLK